MQHDLLACGAAVALAVAVLVAWFGRGGLAKVGAIGLVMLVTAASLIAVITRTRALPEELVATRPIEVQYDGYVTSSKCRACHPREYATWHDSYHRRMTQRAGPQTVVGNFDDVRLQVAGKDYHLERSGNEFWVEMENPIAPADSTASRLRYRVAVTTGSHHMQVYWYETGFTRTMGLLPIAWQIAEQRWIPRRAAFVLPSADKVDPGLGAWSIVCLKCHATNSKPRLDMDNTGLHGTDTHVAEFGIACEACHGPANAHVAANQDPLRRYSLHRSGEMDPSIVNPRRLDPERSTQVCGQCHGSFDYLLEGPRLQDWWQNGFRYRPGEDVLQQRKLKFDGEEQFWSDGLIRVAGREYNALVGSGCHDRGKMTCLSCHVMHQPGDDPRLREQWANDQLRNVEGDQTCLPCHASYAVDIASHTHHAAGSDGSRCQNCHMPHTTYGLMKGVRNHRIASPSVASTLATGRPNACNQCHLDRTLAWTAEQLHAWYGTEQPKLGEDDTRVAAGVLWALKGDAAQRALIAWSLGWDPAQRASGREWIAPYLAELFEDPYESVRIIAERSLRTLPGYGDRRGDLLGSPEARAAAKAAVLETWRKGMQPVGDSRRAVLLGSDGGLLAVEFARLLQQRNNRLVRLFE